jgi:hypothetical protein
MNRRGFVSALAVAGAIAVADVPTACSAPQKTGPPPKVKNVVLVHGAYATDRAGPMSSPTYMPAA